MRVTTGIFLNVADAREMSFMINFVVRRFISVKIVSQLCLQLLSVFCHNECALFMKRFHTTMIIMLIIVH